MKRFILHNYRLKILALVFSIILWFFVGGQKEAQVGFLLSINTVGLPADMVMVTPPPDMVEVRLSGPQGFISRLSPSQVKIDVDLSEAKEGLNNYQINPYDVDVPGGIKVVNLSPSAFDLRIERVMTAILPVRVNFAGTPAKGFKAMSLVAKPSEVEVSGRKNVVTRVKRVYTKLIDIEGFDSTRKLSVPLAYPEGLRGLLLGNVEVTVIIEKKDKAQEK